MADSKNLEKLEVKINQLLEGKRKSQIIVATKGMSRLLVQRHPRIVLIRRELIDKKLDLYVYTVKRRSS